MSTTILLTFAFCFFVIGAFWGPYPANSPWYSRISLVSLGLAAWVLTLLLQGGRFH